MCRNRSGHTCQKPNLTNRDAGSPQRSNCRSWPSSCGPFAAPSSTPGSKWAVIAGSSTSGGRRPRRPVPAGHALLRPLLARTLRVLGQSVSLPLALRAYYIGQLGKYVPGKALVVILRAGLVRGPGSRYGVGCGKRLFRDADDDVGRRTDGGRHRGRLVSWPDVVVLGAVGHDGRRGAAHAAAGVPPPRADGRPGTVDARHAAKTRRPGPCESWPWGGC